MGVRMDGRQADEMRSIVIQPGFLPAAEGSCLIEFGKTKVICTASVEDRVPPFLFDKGTGWLTAEYGMLPRSTHSRSVREAAKGGQKGRTQEIQRLIGRSLRAVVDLDKIGQRTILMDCDVIQADGGTRTASITGAYVALVQALMYLKQEGVFKTLPLHHAVAAVSVGFVDGQALLDLPYVEDSKAEVDMNVVMTDNGEFIELQGTAEGQTFSKDQLDQMVVLAEKGIRELFQAQQDALKGMAECSQS